MTLNIDQNRGMVAPFMKKSGYSFPVLFASEFVDNVEGAYAIPRNWIFDGEGTLCKEQVGFNPKIGEEEWIGDVLEQIAGLTMRIEGDS